jgi:hypothetical protein
VDRTIRQAGHEALQGALALNERQPGKIPAI